MIILLHHHQTTITLTTNTKKLKKNNVCLELLFFSNKKTPNKFGVFYIKIILNYFTWSANALPALNLATFLAAILIVAPV